MLKFFIKNDFDFNYFIKEVEKLLKKGNILCIDLYNESEKKTKLQLEFLFGLLIQEYIAQVKEMTGESWNAKQVQMYYYDKFCKMNYIELPTGQILVDLKTLSKMNKKEVTEFIEKIIDDMLEKGIRISHKVRNSFLFNKDKVKEYKNIVLDKEKGFKNKDEDYLRYQRSLSCIYCGDCNRSEVHHIKDCSETGTALKAPDWYSIPLCRQHHADCDNIGQDFIIDGLPLFGMDIKEYCKIMYCRFLFKI